MPTDIEWATETINPQGWGCWGPGGTPENPQRCWYCYVPRKLIKWPGSKCPLCRQFVPHWHPKRLELPYHWRKPRRIFWGSTSDILHPCTPILQIESILKVVKDTPQHTHIFCTKNPARYQDFNPWPENCWLGTTVTNQADDERVPRLCFSAAPVRFVSVEPMLSEIDSRKWFTGVSRGGYASWGRVNWLILGAMTGPGSQAHQPKREWVQSLIDQARAAGVPLFMKNNLSRIWPGALIQEWPR